MFASRGEYVWFVDSDDFIDPDCLKFIVETMDKNKLDVLVVNHCPCNSDFTYDMVRNNKKELVYSPLKKVPKDQSCSGIRIIRKKIIDDNSISWNKELSPCDDAEFIFFVQSNTDRIAYINNVNYYHIRYENSVSLCESRQSLEKRINSFILLAEVYGEELKKEKYTAAQKKNITARQGLCLQAALLNAVKLEKEVNGSAENVLSQLKQKGLYPYKKVTYDLVYKNYSLKNYAVDIAQFFFPNEHFFRWFSKTVNK